MVNYPEWFAEQPVVIPYNIYKLFHPNKAGHVSFAELASVATRLSRDQIEWMAEKYKIANFKFIGTLLEFAANYPNLLKEGGVVVSPDVLKELRQRRVIAQDSNLSYDNGVQLRLREVPSTKKESSVSTLHLERYNLDTRKWVPLFTYPFECHLD